VNDPIDLREADDKGLTGLYRRTRVEQPPADLDDAILARARRRAARHRQRLFIPLASAALLLVGLSLTLRVLELDKPLEKALEAPSTPAAEPYLDEEAKPAAPRRSRVETVPQPPSPSVRMPAAETAEVESRRMLPPAPAPMPEAAPAAARGFMQRKSRPGTDDGDSMEVHSAPPPGPGGRLQLIRDLLQQGRRDQARELLRALLKSHPELDVPQDLRPLLKHP